MCLPSLSHRKEPVDTLQPIRHKDTDLCGKGNLMIWWFVPSCAVCGSTSTKVLTAIPAAVLCVACTCLVVLNNRANGDSVHLVLQVIPA